MRFLLDTNIVSEGRKRHPNPNVTAWLGSIPKDSLFLSTMVIGELRRGVELIRRRDHRQAFTLESWLNELTLEFTDRILPVTIEVAEEWGRMNSPDRLPAVDGLLAATAKVHHMTLVTRDIGRLDQYGVDVFNPFDPGDQSTT